MKHFLRSLRFFVVPLFALIGPFALFAQKPPMKFGEVTPEMLKMTKYAKDSSASAVVLVDFGVSALLYNEHKGFQINFERITRIKILNKEGLDWANFSIPIYHNGADYEKVSSIKGVTYNLENGKIVQTKLKTDAIFNVKEDENRDQVKVALPNVREGSVIEFTYKITSDFVFNFQNWDFQETIPVEWSEYRADIPEYFNYEKFTQGYISLAISEEVPSAGRLNYTTREADSGSGTSFKRGESSQETIEYRTSKFRWAAQDVPAFKSEPYMTTPSDYVSRIRFELSSTQYPGSPMKFYRGTWDALNKSMLESESFGELVKGSGFLKKFVEEATAGAATPEAKIAAVFNMVRQQMAWNGDKQKYSDGLKKAWEAKTGNSADINLALVSALQKAEISAFPVVVSTRDHGFVRDFIAVSSQFNYVICAVKLGEKTILLDATERSLPMNLIPERCLNGQGYMIAPENHGWVKLMPGQKTRAVTNIDLVLATDGTVTGKVNRSFDGYAAQNMRKTYLSKGEETYVKELANKNAWELSKSTFDNIEKISEPAKESHEVVINNYAQAAGEVIYVNPIPVGRMTETPFKSENRKFPVDFGSSYEELVMGRIVVPEGYLVDELPKPRIILLPANAAKYVYSLTLSGNVISITSQFSINRGIFVQDEYPNLREFYNQVIAKQAEQIVIKKKP